MRIPPLFISQKKTPITSRGIEHRFRKYLDESGLENATVHSLRHSYCKNMLDCGTSIVVVSQLARHESLDTTRIYLTPSQHDLRQAVDNISSEE
jgi:site-specific recombinase XerD